jgi:carbon storage regulator
MLVLMRRVGEKIIIAENITVSVLAIKGNQITIGIDAPPDIPIIREELQKRGLSEKEDKNGNR